MSEKKKKGFQIHPENINRKGRPKKGQTLTDLLKKHLDHIPENEKVATLSSLLFLSNPGLTIKPHRQGIAILFFICSYIFLMRTRERKTRFIYYCKKLYFNG